MTDNVEPGRFHVIHLSYFGFLCNLAAWLAGISGLAAEALYSQGPGFPDSSLLELAW